MKITNTKNSMKSPLSEAIRDTFEDEYDENINHLDFMDISSNNRVCGFALSGEVLVISGDEKVKQEVMDALSQNENTSSSPPLDPKKVSYNNVEYGYAQPHPSSSYLEPAHATECLYDDMTVEEALHFADAVRTPMFEKSLSITTNVIDCLQLQPILTTRIKELTFVQRYVVLVAAEVVTKKDVLFLQDPVVGLSLSDCNFVLRAISEVAKTLRRVVVLTLTHFCHAHLLSFVDRLLLVSASGVVYFGRAEDASQLFLAHLPARQLDFGSSFSDLLADLLHKKLLQDDDRTSYWSEDDFRKCRYVEGTYSLRTLPMKREASCSPFTAVPDRPPPRAASKATVRAVEVSLTQRIRFYARISWWLLWRAWVVRARNSSQLVGQLMYAGLIPGGGLAVTFAGTGSDVAGFQGLCAFLTVSAYGIAILQNSWYIFDIKDWEVYLFERSRLWNRRHVTATYPPPHTIFTYCCCCFGDYFSGCSYLMISPLVTVLADLVVLRLLPPVAACIVVYLVVPLNNAWHAKVTFFATVALLSMLGVVICRCIAVLTLATSKTSEVQARSSIASTSLFCFFVLYSGFLLNPSDLPESKFWIRNWSIYYWLGGLNFASIEQSNMPKITNTEFNNTVNVIDVPLICNIDKGWCNYCNTSEYDHQFLPHPNYTCSFTTTVDLCTLDGGAFANETFCVNADINSTTATITTTEVASGRALLQSLAIEEIGEQKVYGVLLRQAGVYLAVYVLLCVLLNRKENHRLFNRSGKRRWA